MIDQNIREIHPNTIIIYKEYQAYFITNKDVFVLCGIFQFRFYKIENVFVMKLQRNYLNYIKKELKNKNLSYLIVDKINQYHLIERQINHSNLYLYYYQKGRRLYKRFKRIKKLFKILKHTNYSQQKLKEIYYLLEGDLHEATRHILKV